MGDRLFYCGVSLLSACSWALGAILWGKLGERLSSYSLNLAKTAIGTLCLGVVLLFVGVEPVPSRSVVFLALSGILGIAVGDTFFFLALMQLGPRRASLMGALNPAAIAVAAAAFLGERPTPGAWAGIVATTFGVGWVLWERS
ncbi:MAG TPA: DMT family transporter, partial [Candidatus Methylomirabilis sp.]|nr:DMT family transporter [Candidatus Methylomirabilis sp.]